MILFVILLHWWDGRECTAGQFRWNDVYSSWGRLVWLK